jgi:hypothetical protein
MKDNQTGADFRLFCFLGRVFPLVPRQIFPLRERLSPFPILISFGVFTYALNDAKSKAAYLYYCP